MPTPRKGERKKDFMKRCMSVVVGEGKESDQAYAICNAFWEERNQSDPQPVTKKKVKSFTRPE